MLVVQEKDNYLHKSRDLDLRPELLRSVIRDFQTSDFLHSTDSAHQNVLDALKKQLRAKIHFRLEEDRVVKTILNISEPPIVAPSSSTAQSSAAPTPFTPAKR
ncbi:hypothetical protein CLOM_g2638 [Closterium sp. NIES-68]|nr:hypothetical protein CLOM_g2638 [Closterium sp. NIES-68]GJP78369.1 hypothetical protein CLOP_g8678 [Closterium sp. NIES-67]